MCPFSDEIWHMANEIRWRLEVQFSHGAVPAGQCVTCPTCQNLGHDCYRCIKGNVPSIQFALLVGCNMSNISCIIYRDRWNITQLFGQESKKLLTFPIPPTYTKHTSHHVEDKYDLILYTGVVSMRNSNNVSYSLWSRNTMLSVSFWYV